MQRQYLLARKKAKIPFGNLSFPLEEGFLSLFKGILRKFYLIRKGKYYNGIPYAKHIQIDFY